MEQILCSRITEALTNKTFYQKLSISRTEWKRFALTQDWDATLSVPLPMTQRLTCAQVETSLRPALDILAPEPEEGWCAYAYQVACSLLYPQEDVMHTTAQRDAALCFLQVLQVLLDAEREVLPFDPWMDFAFCTEEELSRSSIAGEYRRFMRLFRENFIYELLRLGREVTPFRTLDHIAGVHHVAMTTGRAFTAGGGCMDLALMSGAAAAHDIGKFGCKPGERVPYLHYFYTD